MWLVLYVRWRCACCLGITKCYFVFVMHLTAKWKEGSKKKAAAVDRNQYYLLCQTMYMKGRKWAHLARYVPRSTAIL